MAAAVVLRGVHKAYRTGFFRRGASRVALCGVDLAIEPGEALALRGPNGAGKSTVLRLIAGLVVPDAGRVLVLGEPPHEAPRVRRRIGFSNGDERGAVQRLSVRQNLEFFGALYGLESRRVQARIEELADELELGEFLDRRVDECSAGMKSRLGWARALLHEPNVIVFDEPTRSLDPDLAGRLRGRLLQRVERGASLILATHTKEEVDALRARSILVSQGELESS